MLEKHLQQCELNALSILKLMFISSFYKYFVRRELYEAEEERDLRSFFQCFHYSDFFIQTLKNRMIRLVSFSYFLSQEILCSILCCGMPLSFPTTWSIHYLFIRLPQCPSFLDSVFRPGSSAKSVNCLRNKKSNCSMNWVKRHSKRFH